MSTAAQLVPPLVDGQRLNAQEFVRRWKAMPELKNAELIGGVVHLFTIVSIAHGTPDGLLQTVLGLYAVSTPGCRLLPNTAWVMEAENVPQPDSVLCILPEYGGQWQVEDGVATGAPELAVEVALSSAGRDLHQKLALYERRVVREYLVFVAKGRPRLEWCVLEEGGYRLVEPDADGIYRSQVFPGLWLDSAALLAEEGQRLLATLQQGLASPEHASFVRELVERRRP